MLDPASIGIAITAANTAFSAIKKGFAAGREIESMGKDLSRWMGAISENFLKILRNLRRTHLHLENYLKEKK